MIRFSVLGFKGGVGKSTIAFLLAKELARKYKVLLVDRDDVSTISNLFGIRDGLINALEEERPGSYMVTIGNLRVLNLTALFPRYLPSIERIVPEYKRVIGDADILITDNPPNLDEICELEFKAYRLATGEAHCNSVFVTTPGIALRLTLTHMNEVPKILRTWVPDLAYAKLTALVINMVKGEVGDIPVERKVIIPFKNDLFYSGLRIGTELVEIDQLVKYAEEAIEYNNSGK